MKTGWVIAVEDLHAKDKAFKVISKSREEAAEKAAKLSERYESIEKDRFKVSIASPHTEIDVENRIKIRCKKTEQCPTKLLFSYLHDLSPFCYKQTDEFAFIEIDINENLNAALASVEYSVVE
jgi:hypothetical protein